MITDTEVAAILVLHVRGYLPDEIARLLALAESDVIDALAADAEAFPNEPLVRVLN